MTTFDALGFGTHLILDGFRADAGRLADRDAVAGLLHELAGSLRAATAAEVVWGPRDPRDPGGLSAALVHAEVHLALHTFPQLGKLTLDLFSTRTVPVDAVAARFRAVFAVGRQEASVHGRGRLLPARGEALTRTLRGDRDYARLRLRDLLGS